jgi:hypothetical protein
LTAIDPLKYVVDLPDNIQERDKFDLYNEMILQLQMARDHLFRQQSKKSVSCELLIAFDVGFEGNWRLVKGFVLIEGKCITEKNHA